MTWIARDSSRSWVSVASSSNGTKLVAASIAFSGFVNGLMMYSGPMYTSTDSGFTWTPSAGAGSHHWQSVASSSDGTKLVAVVRYEQIFTSADSGVNWTPRATSSLEWKSVASSSDGTKLVAVVQGGGLIYTSTDSGVTWTARGSSRYYKACPTLLGLLACEYLPDHSQPALALAASMLFFLLRALQYEWVHQNAERDWSQRGIFTE